MQVFSFLRAKPLLYSVLAVYMLGMAVYWDYSLASDTHKTVKQKPACCQVVPKKAKKKCCEGSDTCKAPKKAEKPASQDSKPCPCSPTCPCESRPSPTPSTHMILSNDNIIAEEKKQEKRKFLYKFFQKEQSTNLSSLLVSLPTPASPTFAGKERLRHYCIWRV